MNQVIEIEEEMLSKHIIIFCPVCETETKHVLSFTRQYYACSCGTIVDIEIKEKENEDGL